MPPHYEGYLSGYIKVDTDPTYHTTYLTLFVSIISALLTAQVKYLRHFVANQLLPIYKPQTLICGKLLAKVKSLLLDIEEFRIP